MRWYHARGPYLFAFILACDITGWCDWGGSLEPFPLGALPAVLAGAVVGFAFGDKRAAIREAKRTAEEGDFWSEMFYRIADMVRFTPPGPPTLGLANMLDDLGDIRATTSREIRDLYKLPTPPPKVPASAKELA